MQLDTSSVESSTAIGTIVKNLYVVRARGVVSGCCVCCCCGNYPTVEREVYIDAIGRNVGSPIYGGSQTSGRVLGWDSVAVGSNPNLDAMNRLIV